MQILRRSRMENKILGGKEIALSARIYKNTEREIMIPKRIFYVWGAGEDKRRDVLACMQSWRAHNPDYEIVEINEKSRDYFDFQKELGENRWFHSVYERKMWAHVSDYVRIKVLFDNGGIYLDTDVSVIKPLDEFLKEPAFVGIQCAGTNNYVEPAILGSEKGNPFIGKIRDFYDREIWELPIFTMPHIFRRFLASEYGITEFPIKRRQKIIRAEHITVYPERFFIPFEYNTKFTQDCVEADTYAIHWWGGSWQRPDFEYFLRNKHRIPLPELDEAWRRGTVRKIRFLRFIPIGRVYENKIRVLGLPLTLETDKG
ncbi:MAG: hypothetical protein LBL21_03060, partial [Rickettsiales bacterium]|nr:hypothetical protein [Rickettsiales bacterium]